MSKAEDNEERRNRMSKLSDSLFGDAEEIDRGEAEELLRTAGLDPETIASEVYARLYRQAQEYWIANKPLPPLLKNAIDELRPLTAPPRNEKELGSQARTRMERKVEEARSFPVWTQSTTPEFRPSAYRNKSELSEKDKTVLDEITKRLNNKLKGPRGS
jgi:hypothetical protein